MKFFPSTTTMRFSVISFLIVLAVGLLSMGFLGVALYTIASPILNIFFPPLDSLHGDWVWPALILAGMIWSFSFLVAGWVYLYASKLDWNKTSKVLLYIFILLLWNLILWTVILNGK